MGHSVPPQMQQNAHDGHGLHLPALSPSGVMGNHGNAGFQSFSNSMSQQPSMQYNMDTSGPNSGVFGMMNSNSGAMQMMGESDGFTLVKGISSYGLKKQIRRANIDDGRTSNMSDLSKTINSQLDKNSRTQQR